MEEVLPTQRVKFSIDSECSFRELVEVDKIHKCTGLCIVKMEIIDIYDEMTTHSVT